MGEVPQQYEIRAVNVKGTESDAVVNYVRQVSGLTVGQKVTVPGDPAFSDAIRNIYTPGLFSDVQISTDSTAGGGVYLSIHVKEEPKLASLKIEGVKRGERDDLKKKVDLPIGRPVRPSDLEAAKQVVRDYYSEKGYALTDISVSRDLSAANNTVDLTLHVDKGSKVRVGDIIIKGNEDISDHTIASQLENNKKHPWWQFWKKSKFDEDKLDEDLQNVLAYYREQGYYDARIVQDTVWIEQEDGKPRATVKLTVHEGPQYHVRSVTWEGNTVYPDQVLTQALGFEKGDVYDETKLNQNLYANRHSTDIASLYMNRGYMRFNAQPTVLVVPGDSLDLHFDVTEGDIYTFGNIDIEGNTKTKEHVIRRELYTVPGQTFSRESIQESIRRLSQLNYFNQEDLAKGPNVQVDEADKQVDLTYNVEEVGSDQLELSGTWGRYGLILMLRFGFNNFSAQRLFDKSAWKPLPSGDGQKLQLAVQTNGRYYQSYSVSFTEPWYRGRPTPVGFSVMHSRLGDLYSRYYNLGADTTSVSSDRHLITTSARAFYQRRLKWPDNFFNLSTSIGYQYYLNRNLVSYIPTGLNQEISFEESISRSSLDNPTFPMRGSQVEFSVKIAPPIPGFIQYHKWRFTSSWNIPIANKLSFGLGTDLGYVGSLTGKPVKFERFDVGGSPFDVQGYYNFGTDVVYMRGYPRSALTPRNGSQIIGGTVLNKFTSELRWLAIQTPQLQAAPYLFMDAANTWNGFKSYNPAELYRSAGVGLRLFLPIVGMLELTYGYNFDEFTPLDANTDGSRHWYFQFSLGQGFNQ